MKIFGIGFSRTGTRSLNSALGHLGFNTVHYPMDPVTAMEVVKGLPYSILERSDGMTDIHAAVRFRDLDAQYPDSRFVLTTREKGAWLASCRRHFERYRPGDKPPLIRKMILRLRKQAYGVVQFDEESFSAAYDRHVESVVDHFRMRNQLLVIDIPRGEGWNALCGFLDKRIPAEPFPFIR